MDKDVSPKGKVLVEVTFPPSGVVRFFCKFHSALGMNGICSCGGIFSGSLLSNRAEAASWPGKTVNKMKSAAAVLAARF